MTQIVEENQVIVLADGSSVSIKNLKIGDSVSYFCSGVFKSTPISKVEFMGKKKVIGVVVEGRELLCTNKYQLLTKSGHKLVKDISLLGDELAVIGKDDKVIYLPIDSYLEYPSRVSTYSLQLENNLNFITEDFI